MDPFKLSIVLLLLSLGLALWVTDRDTEAAGGAGLLGFLALIIL